jgi:hypothetical protein
MGWLYLKLAFIGPEVYQNEETHEALPFGVRVRILMICTGPIT